MATRTDAGLLRLIWLASPALPVGGFSYSEGLEAAVEAALVHDETSAGDWVLAQLQLVLAQSDLAVVAQAVDAFRAGDTARVEALDQWVRRTRETRESRLQSEQMGRSLGDWSRSLGDTAERVDRTYPVAFAAVAAGIDAPVHDVVLAFAFGWAENMVQAAVKAVPLGQGAGQRVLQRLAAAIPAAASHAIALPDEERQAFAPMLAILSARHETQYSRLFRS
ncbi:urease accessory protein UreF [Ramlibacter sp. MMS24-I3-19]|uniref:urease accessory protein UreF n=1 Tax=Ramlibacter sp. MMS24-I3-19 TaxID=3416606 RepID=UPI003D06A526